MHLFARTPSIKYPCQLREGFTQITACAGPGWTLKNQGAINLHQPTKLACLVSIRSIRQVKVPCVRIETIRSIEPQISPNNEANCTKFVPVSKVFKCQKPSGGTSSVWKVNYKRRHWIVLFELQIPQFFSGVWMGLVGKVRGSTPHVQTFSHKKTVCRPLSSHFHSGYLMAKPSIGPQSAIQDFGEVGSISFGQARNFDVSVCSAFFFPTFFQDAVEYLPKLSLKIDEWML